MFVQLSDLFVQAKEIINDIFSVLDQEVQWFQILQLNLYSEQAYPEPYLRSLLEWSWRVLACKQHKLAVLYQFHELNLNLEHVTNSELPLFTAILEDLFTVNNAITAGLNALVELVTTFRGHMRTPDGIYDPFFVYGFFTAGELKLAKAREKVHIVAIKSVLRENNGLEQAGINGPDSVTTEIYQSIEM